MKVSARSRKFLWLGNSAALDFVNTQIVRDGRVADLLESGQDLLLWLNESALLRSSVPGASPVELEQVLAFARRFRAQLRKGLEHIVQRGSVPDSLLDVVNRLLGMRTCDLRLVRRGRRLEWQQIWHFSSPASYCVPIAYSLAQLLQEGDLRRLRRCSNPECILFFYDTSKSATRAWCSLDLCGNKLRVRAFREREKSAP